MGKVSGIIGVLLLAAASLAAQTAADVGKKSGETVASHSEVVQGKVNAEGAIRAELDAQVAAWNRGDLKGYMQGYWKSEELTFFAGSKESAGWEAAYQRYRAAYSGKGKGMGKLKFSSIRVELLSPEAGFVRGGWQLTMKDGSQRNGLFTVLLKKFNDGWKIIHDHSS